jgi:hypothetical protein
MSWGNLVEINFLRKLPIVKTDMMSQYY